MAPAEIFTHFPVIKCTVDCKITFWNKGFVVALSMDVKRGTNTKLQRNTHTS